jgi:3-isopropylmalate/(R)-2-methylmalate dehydratase large subunit
LSVDRILLHERTGGIALKSLRDQGLDVLDASRCFSFMDHIVAFRPGPERARFACRQDQ